MIPSPCPLVKLDFRPFDLLLSHGVNVKLLKTGGISAACAALQAARKAGLKTMIGCMIETSVLISAAAHLAALADHLDIDGNLLVSNDPYLGATAENGVVSFARAPEPFGLRVRPRNSDPFAWRGAVQVFGQFIILILILILSLPSLWSLPSLKKIKSKIRNDSSLAPGGILQPGDAFVQRGMIGEEEAHNAGRLARNLQSLNGRLFRSGLVGPGFMDGLKRPERRNHAGPVRPGALPLHRPEIHASARTSKQGWNPGARTRSRPDCKPSFA